VKLRGQGEKCSIIYIEKALSSTMNPFDKQRKRGKSKRKGFQYCFFVFVLRMQAKGEKRGKEEEGWG
jgi:hypothetical protein